MVSPGLGLLCNASVVQEACFFCFAPPKKTFEPKGRAGEPENMLWPSPVSLSLSGFLMRREAVTLFALCSGPLTPSPSHVKRSCCLDTSPLAVYPEHYELPQKRESAASLYSLFFFLSFTTKQLMHKKTESSCFYSSSSSSSSMFPRVHAPHVGVLRRCP